MTVPAPAVAKTSWISRSTAAAPVAKARIVAKGSATSGSAAGLSGRNHVWMPALGIRRRSRSSRARSSAYPGNRVYRWGCAGRNNVYLFGHAYSVFKPLHDAYVRGRLKKGMKLYYADSARQGVDVQGHLVAGHHARTRAVSPTPAQSRPSLTLQTCVGARASTA